MVPKYELYCRAIFIKNFNVFLVTAAAGSLLLLLRTFRSGHGVAAFVFPVHRRPPLAVALGGTRTPVPSSLDGGQRALKLE